MNIEYPEHGQMKKNGRYLVGEIEMKFGSIVDSDTRSHVIDPNMQIGIEVIWCSNAH